MKKPDSLINQQIRTVALCNLGCSKNVVDGESMIGFLQQAGYQVVEDFSKADVILVNTCAFIQEAKQEAIDSILEAADYKKNGSCKILAVCGCFSERYHSDVAGKFPEVDHWIGVHQWHKEFKRIFSRNEVPAYHRKLTGSITTQYLKIADGCSHRCSFCVIPDIRGNYKSRKYDEIHDEAIWLYDQGVRECILVSQDTSFYGRDIKSNLTLLLQQLIKDTQFPWIRLMYLHPAYINDDLLKLIASEPRICRYFDIPMQHISDSILKSMRRKPDAKGIYALIDKIREKVPDCAIRTSLIVGYPGETEKEFNELKQFVEASRFDKLGVFPYSPEEGTPASSLHPRPRNVTIQRRCEELMEIQRDISREIGQTRINRKIPVIIDGQSETPEYVLEGRTQWDAPEIDGKVLIKQPLGAPGQIIPLLIRDAGDYDLYA
jgi:ribosomal protein S12 methylthiotransferase